MISVINIVPQSLSGETNQDSEPNITVNAANPNQIAISAFTPDPLGGSNAPIYISGDGGSTWALNSIIPGNGFAGTGDITLRFAGRNNHLYAGILRGDVGLRLNILRTGNYAATTPMDVLVSRDQVDQPYLEVATVLSGPGANNDRVYVGNNNFASGSATGRSATVDLSIDAATAPAPSGLAPMLVEARDPGSSAGQDGPQVRSTIHGDGTIYSVFYHWTDFSSASLVTSDIVVVRDDNWGAGSAPFTALSDPGDGVAGRRVVTGIQFTWNQIIGQQRLGGNVSIAVDPRNSSLVYLVWADVLAATGSTLHVTRSADRGATWSPDLKTVDNATNAALAINSNGQICLLYQKLTGGAAASRWETHLLRTDTAFGTVDDQILATTPAATPSATFSPYLGDYLGLVAVGKDFYGVFSANNTPDLANFPQGVTYLRNANFTSKQLLDIDNVTPTPISIDPFFFKSSATTTDSDFYVRDWTASGASGDDGAQPSSEANFFSTSDVWNRRGDAPGGFNANDQPQNENPQSFVLGDNFAFARVRRNAAGVGAAVGAHFLYSEFGTGSNYQDANVDPDSVVSFTGSDTVLTMANGYRWQLPPTASNHLCLAVQLSAPGDAFIPPSLLGRAPGWPTTDLAVLNDNNKGQRNMGVYPAAGTGSICTYALVHNAATFRRTIELRTECDERALKSLGDLRFGAIGSGGVEGRRTVHSRFKPGGFVHLPNMEPGENRWVSLCFTPPKGQDGALLPITVFEVVEGLVVNGFAIAPRPSPIDDVIRFNLDNHGTVFSRLAAAFQDPEVEPLAKQGFELARQKRIDPDRYLVMLAESAGDIVAAIKRLTARQQLGDPFGLAASARRLAQAIDQKDLGHVMPMHQSLVNGLDAFMSMALKRQGDPADILQTVLWQRDLFAKTPSLRGLAHAGRLVSACDEFAVAYGERKTTNDDYPTLTKRVLPAFSEAEKALPALGLGDLIRAMTAAMGAPATLQAANRALLLRMQTAS